MWTAKGVHVCVKNELPPYNISTIFIINRHTARPAKTIIYWGRGNILRRAGSPTFLKTLTKKLPASNLNFNYLLRWKFGIWFTFQIFLLHITLNYFRGWQIYEHYIPVRLINVIILVFKKSVFRIGALVLSQHCHVLVNYRFRCVVSMV